MTVSTLETPATRHCRRCGGRMPSGPVCPECEAAHCSKASCNALLDDEVKPAGCPQCGVFTVYNRVRERVGLRGKHAVAERRKAADALVPDVLAEHGIEIDKATPADKADADALAEARVLRRKGFDVCQRYEVDSEAGRDGLRQWSAGFDREMRRSVLLRARHELRQDGGMAQAVTWRMVDANGVELASRRHEPVGATVTEQNTLAITRVIVDPDPADFASDTARRALHPEQYQPEVRTTSNQYQPEPEPVIEAVLVPERKPAQLTKQEHAALLAKQTRRTA